MNFKKNLWFCLLFICFFTTIVRGLNEDKLKYWTAEIADFNIEHLPKLDDAIIEKVLNTAKRQVENKAKLYAGVNARPKRSFHEVREEVWDIHRQVEIGSRAIDILSSEQNLTKEASHHLVKRIPPRDGINFNVICQPRQLRCISTAKFRNFDGSCNNINSPDLGMAVIKQNRLLNPKYADGLNSPRRARSGRPLPLSRVISMNAMPDITNEDPRITHMNVQFGQFLSHDIVGTPDRTDLSDCCNNRNPDCLPLMIPMDDPQLGPQRIGCMQFARAIRACGTGVRQQINQVSSFIDASHIYGSDVRESNNLRTFRQGLLQTSDSGLNMPVNPGDTGCATRGTGRNFCFRTGDNRVNIQPGLMAVHTLFLREHNRIARELQLLLPQLTDEQIYQETRRVVIAELESIVYNEYLPTILGPHIMTKYRLNLPKDEKATVYDSKIDPAIINSFAVAAFRFGHSLIHNFGKVGTSGDRFALKDNYNNPTVIHRAGADAVLIGSVNQNAEGMDNLIVEAVSRFLFKTANSPVGLDLAAFNVERGRDHGIPSYNEFRVFCELPRINTFDELRDAFSDPRAVDELRNIYEHVDDIDLYPAGIAETPIRDGVVGPTFACIMGIQFHRLLHGDRYFYTHENNNPGRFQPRERAILSKRTLSSIMCDNLRVSSVQLNAFLTPNDRNPIVACNSHPKIDFRLFIAKR